MISKAMLRSILLSILLLSGCAAPKNDDGKSLNDVNSSSAIHDVSIDPPGTAGATPGGVQASVPIYATSTGGTITANQRVTLPLLADQKVRGMAADATGLYLLVRRDLGSGVVRWDFWRYVSTSGIVTELCSLLDDGHFTGGLALSGNQLLTFYSGSYSTSGIRRFDRTSCLEAPVISYGQDAYYAMPDDRSAILVEGSVYRIDVSSGRTHETYDPGTGLLTAWNLASTSVGTRVFSFNGMQVLQGALMWAIDGSTLWKFSGPTGNALGWAELPARDYGDLSSNSIRAVAMADASTLIVMTAADPSAVKFYYFGVGRF